MANPLQVITSYIRSSVAELKKVTWPTKEMTMRYSALVIVVSVAVAAFFAGLDYAFSRLITQGIAGNRSAVTQTETPTIPDLESNTVQSEETTPGIEVQATDESGDPIDGNQIQIQPIE